MQIPINKDIEESFKNEFIKGFTLWEVSFVAISLVIIAGATYIAWRVSGMDPGTCIYIGLPFGLPALVMGFKKFQGLTFFAYVKERMYEMQTRILIYDADELPDDSRVFSMERKTKSKGRRKKI